MAENRNDQTPANMSISKALGIFKCREDFNKFLEKHDFIKKLSALSYLESVEDNQGHYVVHLYFIKSNRLRTMRSTFGFAEFYFDEDQKRDRFDEGNELSKYIRDLQKQNGIEEIIKKVVKPKPVPQPRPQSQPQILHSQDPLEQMEVDKVLHKRLPSFSSEEDMKSQSKRIKSEPNLGKKTDKYQQLRELYDKQSQELEKMKQSLRKVRLFLRGMLNFLPVDEAQIAQEELQNIESFLQDGSDEHLDEDEIEWDEQALSISKFFNKDSDISLTSPVLMPVTVTLKTTTMEVEEEVQKEREAEKRDILTKITTEPMQGNKEAQLQLQLQPQPEAEAEEEKIDKRKESEGEVLYSTPPSSQTLVPSQVRLPKNSISTSAKLDSKQSVVDQIKFMMELKHLRYAALKNSEYKSKPGWSEAITCHKKTLMNWEKELESSYIYYYNHPALSPQDKIGWNANIDLSFEISSEFEVRNHFRKAASHWYVSYLVDLWKENPGLSINEIVGLIRNKKEERTKKGMITWYIDDLIFLFQHMEAYLMKEYPQQHRAHKIERALQHSESQKNWGEKLDLVLDVYPTNLSYK